VCGVCGIVTRAAGGPDPGVLEAMRAAVVHRGPDSEGALLEGPVALGARRLAIIDLEHGDQPMEGPEGRAVVVQNGEILNHAQLRREIEGAGGPRLRTRCDTEVIAALYEREGPGFVERLRGMFALAVWDRAERRLLLARDRFGIKPLFYHEDADQLAFASELTALMRLPGFSRELDPDALEAYLAFNSIPAPLTVFGEARKLPPGHLLLWRDGHSQLRRYARPAPAAAGDLRREPAEQLADELLTRLRDSVRAHLVADVPVGVLLSGGIDSSLLCALAAQEGDRPVSTFSIGFEERTFDELERARVIARRYGTDHHEIVVRPDAAELLPRLVERMDEPLGDSSALPTWLVAQLAAGHVKVVLSGEGGDELFGGYETYAAGLLAERAGWAARLLRPVADRLPSSDRRVPLDYRLKRFTAGARLPPLDRHHAFKEIFGAAQRRELLGAAAGRDPLREWRHRWAETDGAEPLARLQDVDLGLYLVDDLLVKTDRMTMAHSLEARVPFLDPVVADLALALPTRHKVRGLAKKRLLRRAATPLVGREIARARKRGFSIPAAAWLRGPLVPFAREVLAPGRLRSQGIIEPAAASDLLVRHQAGREDLSRQLWGLLCLSLWLERVEQGAPSEGVPAGGSA
jgi:asparagine synthase (glutamine-hydrolysing)